MKFEEKIRLELKKTKAKIKKSHYKEKFHQIIDGPLEDGLDLFPHLKRDMDKKYDHHLIENVMVYRYQKTERLQKHDLSKKPFTIILPPPNVTGILHLGHAWNGALQDSIIRYKKLQHYDTLFLPSMDHAGIATQAKIEQLLTEQGTNKQTIGREKFLEITWNWKVEKAKEIKKQWRKLGLNLNYEAERFTLDEQSSNAVNKAFILMYEQGLIYRGSRAINWDVELQTSLSNIEVINKAVESKMYYLKYFFQDSEQFLTIATTRPETLFSDVAVAFNPEDDRYQKYLNQYVINPLTKKPLKILSDSYVTESFATGLMKVSAHAKADIEIIYQNNLPIVECIDRKGKMTKAANSYLNLDRFVAREKIAKKLNADNLVVKVEKIENNVAYSQRSNSVIEILVFPQWFVKTKPLAQKVLTNLKSSKSITFFPERFKDVMEKWMNEMEDWNISRQLWWGHQLPVWYKNNQIKVQLDRPGEGWIQDEDVLDTWFSSALAPFSFLGWPENNDFIKHYYPTSLLVTAYDILFFWIAKMYFFGLSFMNEIPFNEVLIHGLIRDENGLKMSKSLGNGIDPMELIEKYGADSLRWFLLTNSTPGHDLNFSAIKMRSSWNFINKIWNIARFIIQSSSEELNKIQSKHDDWILNKLNFLNRNLIAQYDKYEFTIVKKYVQNFVYNEFSSWYIEISKENFNKNVAKQVLGELLIMVHPIMPFFTDYLYRKLYNQTILATKWPELHVVSETSVIDQVIEVVQQIRNFRAIHNLSSKVVIFYYLDQLLDQKYLELVNQLSNGQLQQNQDTVFPLSNNKLFIVISPSMKEKQAKTKKQKIKQLQAEIIRSKKILNNQAFLKKANPKIKSKEQEKYLKYKQQLEELLKS